MHEIAVEQGFAWAECLVAARERGVPIKDGRVPRDRIATVYFAVMQRRGEPLCNQCGKRGRPGNSLTLRSDFLSDTPKVVTHAFACDYESWCGWRPGEREAQAVRERAIMRELREGEAGTA